MNWSQKAKNFLKLPLFMQTTRTIQQKMTIREVLDTYPETAKVFIHRRMACVGCPVEGFDTLEDAARIYQIDVQELLDDLQQAIAGNP